MVEVSPDIKVPTSQSHHINPSNAEATFVQSTRTQNIMKIILNLSYRYSFERPCCILSYEYPCARVSVILFRFLASLCIGQISHQQQIGLKITI